MRGEKRKQNTCICSIIIDIICVKSRFLKSTTHEFSGDQVQANNTVLQNEHSKYRKKGIPTYLTNMYANCTEGNSRKRKSTSICPHDKGNCCGFHFTIFCSKQNNMWFLLYGNRFNSTIYHTKHMQPNFKDMCTTYYQLKDEEKKELMKLVQSSANIGVIKSYMFNKMKVLINDGAVKIARYEFMNLTMKKLGLDPGSSTCDRLLQLCKNMDDISFISVTHSVNSSFMKKSVEDKNFRDITSSISSENNKSINSSQLLS